MRYRLRRARLIFILLLLATAAVVVLVGASRTPVQPIAYNHRLHIEDVGLSCEDCHGNVSTHARASIPNIEVCSQCHGDPEGEEGEARKVADYVAKEKKIPWVQTHLVPDYAYFSHRRHVALGGLECSACHGEVEKMEKPFQEPHVRLRMEWCMDCHDDHGVSNDCYACHR